MRKLVLLRHGESSWNRENRFTGWTDVGLTEHGLEVWRQPAGQSHQFDIALRFPLQAAAGP